MPHPSLLSISAALLVSAALAACSPAKPPETPEASGDTPDKDKEKDKDKDKGEAEPAKEASPEAAATAEPGGKQGGAPGVDKSMSLDTYEMTPSDCNELGRHYGDVARDDQMKGLSPKLNEKQRSSTVAQIDKVVGKIEETWTTGCHASLENKAVDHDAIKCALGARTVKDFDVCINGAAGTPQPAGKPGKKKR